MDRRTALVTAASITGVIITGAVAVGANVHILGQADDSGVGELSASSASEVRDLVELSDASEVGLDPIDGSGAAADGAEIYQVDDAGTAEIIRRDDSLLLGRVEPAAGWTWTVDQSSEDLLTVTFASTTTSYVLTAGLDVDGGIVASVSEPIPGPAPAPAAATAEHHDDGEYEDHGDDEHEDEEHEDEEHEGRDDDD